MKHKSITNTAAEKLRKIAKIKGLTVNEVLEQAISEYFITVTSREDKGEGI